MDRRQCGTLRVGIRLCELQVDQGNGRHCPGNAMIAARLPLEYRDYCAHILIPLNECRRQTWFSPWKCTDLRHSYEKCQYDEYQRRVAILKTERPTQFFSSR